MQTVLKNIADERLKMYIVWLPILESDDRNSADERSNEFSDSRIHYLWDPEKLSGAAWQKTLGLKSTAWDVYLLFGPDAVWDKEPAVPYSWMHQLREADQSRWLIRLEFESETRELLNKMK